MTTNTATAPAAQAVEADDCFLPARKVWERYGITDMTLHRWIRDERMGFPAPLYIGRFRYWRMRDLTAFERQRVSGKAAA